MSDRFPFVPRLARDHPGYFKVVLSLVLVHFGLAADALGGRGIERSPGFKVIVSVLGKHTYSMTGAHIVTAILIIAGLYWRDHFVLVRYGCALSLILFNVLAVGFAFASFLYDLSYYGAIASVTLSLSSLAALKEPPVQSAVRT